MNFVHLAFPTPKAFHHSAQGCRLRLPWVIWPEPPTLNALNPQNCMTRSNAIFRVLLMALEISSRLGKAAVAAFLFFGLLAPLYAADDYERDVRNLAAGTPDGDLEASLRALKSGGLAAFPILIAHFSDWNAAEPRYFQGAQLERAPDGSRRLHPPTIGETCFGILQRQIEGAWPIAFRVYHVLTPTNTKEWLDAHQGFTLAQFRRASLEESLRRASADHAKEAVVFLLEELESVNQ
jgi:hypothetical protein